MRLAIATLLLFLSLPLSAQEEASPWISDNPFYVKGKFGDALRFDFWRSRIFLKAPGFFKTEEGTLQFWVSPLKDLEDFSSYGTLVSTFSDRAATKYATFSIGILPPFEARGGNSLSCIIRSKNPASLLIKNLGWRKGEWHAIAITWGNGGLRIFIDGKLAGETKGKPANFDETPDLISFGGGTGMRYQTDSDSSLDEIELSDCARSDSYIKAYAEASAPIQPDKHTSAIKRCDSDSSKDFWQITSNYRETVKPFAISGSAFLGDYRVAKAGESPKLPLTLVNPGAGKCRFNVSITIKDYKAAPAGSLVRDFDAGPGKILEPEISPEIKTPGWYSYAINVVSEDKTLLDEEHSFVILPEMPPNILNPSNHFGDHLIGTRKNDLFAIAGIPWERDMQSFTWNRIEPEKGVWDWRAADFIVAEAAKNKLSLVALLGHPASWAGKGPQSPETWKNSNATKKATAHAPRDIEEFSEYVFNTVSRYKGAVKHWEIWNEPDWNQPNLEGVGFTGSNAEYLDVLKAGYEAAKKADPDCVVLSGGFVPHPHLINYLVENGGCRYFDILGMHRYRSWEDFAKYAQLVKKPFWQTEHLVSNPFDIAHEAVVSMNQGCGKFFFFDAMTAMTNFDKEAFDAHGWEPQPVYFATAQCAAKIGNKTKSGSLKFDRMGKLLEGLLFDRGLPTQTAAVFFNYVGPNRLKIAFKTASQGKIAITNLMGERETLQSEPGKELSAEVNCIAYIEGDFIPESFRVASFEESELLLNNDFKLLEGDMGIDKLAGMKPKRWVFRTEKGNIGMRQAPLVKDGLAVAMQSPGEGPQVRTFQLIDIATPGTYKLSADFMLDGAAPQLSAYIEIYDVEAKKSVMKKAWKDLSASEWRNFKINFKIEEDGQHLAAVFGIERGKGTLLLKSPRLERVVDEGQLAKTVFIDLKPHANQGFSEELDPKGIWPELGKANLSLLETGLRDYVAALFKIEPDSNGKSCIILGTPKRPALPLEVKKIKVGAKLEDLCILDTAMFVEAKDGESLGECVIHYADGSNVSTQFIKGKDIDDWYPPLIGKDVKVAGHIHSPDGTARAIFLKRWVNPKPEAQIDYIDLKSSGRALLAIIAIAGNATQK